MKLVQTVDDILIYNGADKFFWQNADCWRFFKTKNQNFPLWTTRSLPAGKMNKGKNEKESEFFISKLANNQHIVEKLETLHKCRSLCYLPFVQVSSKNLPFWIVGDFLVTNTLTWKHIVGKPMFLNFKPMVLLLNCCSPCFQKNYGDRPFFS